MTLMVNYLRNIWGREARLIVRSIELMAGFEQTREYIVCIQCLWMIYFENQDFPSSLQGKGETWSFESSSVTKVLRQYLGKELTASTTKCL